MIPNACSTFEQIAQLLDTLAHSQSSKDLGSLLICAVPHGMYHDFKLSDVVALLEILRAEVLLSSHALFRSVLQLNDFVGLLEELRAEMFLTSHAFFYIVFQPSDGVSLPDKLRAELLLSSHAFFHVIFKQSDVVGLLDKSRAKVFLTSHASFHIVTTVCQAGCTPLTARSCATTLLERVLALLSSARVSTL